MKIQIWCDKKQPYLIVENTPESQTSLQESLIVALSNCAIKFDSKNLIKNFNRITQILLFCQQGRLSKIIHICCYVRLNACQH